MRVGKVDSPYTGTGTDIKDTSIFLLGAEHQLLIVRCQALIVEHFQTLLLLLVIR